jgi:serine protease
MTTTAHRCFLALLILWSALCAPAVAAPAATALIVRLQAAPPHATSRATALAAQEQAARALHASRWRGLLADTGLAAVPGLRLEPVGRASFRLRPGRAWSVAEAARWQATLAARPEVAWAVPDERETRLQAATTPNDPLFGGDLGQWWLQPVSGGNADAPMARRRGLPGIATAWAQHTTGMAGTVIAVLDSGWTAHPDLDPARLLPGYDMVSDWDEARQRGTAHDGDGRDADARDPGDGVSAAERAADPTRYAGCDESASSWHGSAVMGLVAAHSDNAQGVAGIDWAARLLPVRVAGQCGATVRDIVDGMRWAAGLPVCRRFADSQDPDAGCADWAPLNPTPARIVNLSYGGAAACNTEYQDAIDELWARGVVVVAAAGNGHGAPSRPASCERVVGVTAVNRDGFKTHYANFGAALRIATVGGDDAGGRWGALLADDGLLGLTNLGLQAPGEPSYASHSGTSFAAPVVSGTLGLMLALHPGLTPQQLLDGLAASARPHVQSPLLAACSAANPGRCACGTATCGAGLLDAPQALAYAQALAAGQPYAAPAWPIEQVDTPQLRQAVALGPDREGAAAETPATPAGEEGTGGGGLPSGALWGLVALAGLARRRSGKPTGG